MDKQKKLAVSETFYSIQGEGPTMGFPAVFLRLTGCNLLCQSKTWLCDTIEVWREGLTKSFDQVLSKDLLNAFTRVNKVHLVITGGEPLLQKERIVEYIKWLDNRLGFIPYIEIETNGTILPHNEIRSMINQWNVSFKLSNSGEPYSKRINDVALRWFNNRPNAYFKLVVANEGDVIEILQDYYINPSKIILMPAGATQEELNITRPEVVRLAKEFGMRYCDRLHIVTWNKKTGV